MDCYRSSYRDYHRHPGRRLTFFCTGTGRTDTGLLVPLRGSASGRTIVEAKREATYRFSGFPPQRMQFMYFTIPKAIDADTLLETMRDREGD